MGKDSTPRKNTTPLPARIHIQEFLLTVDMTTVEKSGFVAYAKGKVWMRPKEWSNLLKEYKNRKGE